MTAGSITLAASLVTTMFTAHISTADRGNSMWRAEGVGAGEGMEYGADKEEGILAPWKGRSRPRPARRASRVEPRPGRMACRIVSRAHGPSNLVQGAQCATPCPPTHGALISKTRDNAHWPRLLRRRRALPGTLCHVRLCPTAGRARPFQHPRPRHAGQDGRRPER